MKPSLQRPGRRRRRRLDARADERRGMSQDDIEASKAPLIEHLIELRSRLMRAMIAIFIAFIVCFYLRQRHLQPSDHPLREGGGTAARDQADLHRAAGVFLHADEAGALRRAVPRVPGDRQPDLQVRRAGPLSQRARRPSCRSSSRRRSSSRSAPCSSISASCRSRWRSSCRWSSTAVRARRRSSFCRRSTSISG